MKHDVQMGIELKNQKHHKWKEIDIKKPLLLAPCQPFAVIFLILTFAEEHAVIPSLGIDVPHNSHDHISDLGCRSHWLEIPISTGFE